MIKGKPVFDYDQCLSCGMCAQGCPFSCMEMTLKGKQGKYINVFPELSKPESCIGCGMCAKSCPMGCISIQGGPDEG